MTGFKQSISCLVLIAYMSSSTTSFAARETYPQLLRESSTWLEMLPRGQKHTGIDAVVDFSDGILTKPEAESLSKKIASLDTNKLQIRQEKNFLSLSYDRDNIKIEIKDLEKKQFLVNGKLFSYNDRVGFDENAKILEKLINVESTHTQIFNRILNLAIPSAHAIEGKTLIIAGLVVLAIAAVIYMVKKKKDKDEEEEQQAKVEKAKKLADKKEQKLKDNFRDNLWHYRTKCDMAAHTGAAPHYVMADDACPQKSDKAARSECLRTKGDDCKNATSGHSGSASSH